MFLSVSLIAVAFFGAVLGNEVEDEITAARNKINNATQTSQKDLESCLGKIGENTVYLGLAVKRFIQEGQIAEGLALSKVDTLMRKATGERIDKNKAVNSFKCVFTAQREHNNTIKSAYEKSQECLNSTVSKPEGEQVDFILQIGIIKETTLGLYMELLYSLGNCTTPGCATPLGARAEQRSKNLKNVLNNYSEKSFELRSLFNENALGCIQTMQSTYDNAVRNCENKMRFC